MTGSFFCKLTPEIEENKLSTPRKLTMPCHRIYHNTPTSLKTGLKNTRRSTPTRDQNPLPEVQEEVCSQTTNHEADFDILVTQIKEINLTNIPSSHMDGIMQKLTSLQNKAERLQQQQLQV